MRIRYLGTWHAAAHPRDLDEGQAIALSLAGRSLLLVRSGDAVHAIADRCSHADQELAGGIVRNGWIACPAHGSRFDLASGEPLNPPATVCIATYAVRIQDGLIEVCLPR